MILSRLPGTIRMEWARKMVGKENDLKGLLEFLKAEIQCRERSETYNEDKSVSNPGSVLSLQTISKSTNESRKVIKCGVCNKRHGTQNCWDLTSVDPGERKKRIRSANLCFRCLSGSHTARSCDSVCAKCKGHHHVLLCQGNPPNTDRRNYSRNVNNSGHPSRNTRDVNNSGHVYQLQ